MLNDAAFIKNMAAGRMRAKIAKLLKNPGERQLYVTSRNGRKSLCSQAIVKFIFRYSSQCIPFAALPPGTAQAFGLVCRKKIKTAVFINLITHQNLHVDILTVIGIALQNKKLNPCCDIDTVTAGIFASKKNDAEL